MKSIHLILGFLTFLLIECKSPQKQFGKINIFFENAGELKFPQETIDRKDSCILRFMAGFKNDSIWILSEKQKSLIIANTNESIGFAFSHKLNTVDLQDVEVKINETEFLIPLNRKYYAIDVYKRSKDTINIYYSNYILILSSR